MVEEKEEDISELRDKIDELDKKIVELLNRRADAAFKIRELKNRGKIPIYDAKREEEIFQRIIELSEGPLSEDSLRLIYQEILRCMKNFE